MNRLRIFLALLAMPVASASAAGLGGSRASVREAWEVAREHEFTFLRTPQQVREFVEKEQLVEVTSNEHLEMAKVSFPYTRPAIRTFIQRLAEQFHRATGDRLVVTSLTRPTSMQPRNASPFSVHPAGMAVDLRIPKVASQRAWLERALLQLEAKGVLDVTRERRPPHYHIAVFPERYEAYVGPLIQKEIEAAAETVLERMSTAVQVAAAPQPRLATAPGLPGHPGLLVATLGGGLLLMSFAGGLTIRHARRHRRTR